MKKIKNYIIHLLGGITEDENEENQVNCHRQGEYIALYKTKIHMEVLNGTPADDWCKEMYSYVSDRMKNLENYY